MATKKTAKKSTTAKKAAAKKLTGKHQSAIKKATAKSTTKSTTGKSAAAKPGTRKSATQVSQREGKPSAVSRGSAPATSAPAKRTKTRATRIGAKTAKVSAGGALDGQQLAHGLHALLHTMHTIQNYEEKLCSMMHAMRHGRAPAALQRELAVVLQELPVADYREDVESLLHALE